MNNWLEIKQKIIAYSNNIGLDKIGFTHGEPFWNIEGLFREHRDKGYSSGFEEKDIKLRINPALSLPSVRSIISIGLAYPSSISQSLDCSKKSRGRFCRASWGQDYHFVLKGKLEKLAEYIKSLVPQAETLIMVDTGPLSDRAVAFRAGLGWIGKNGSLVTKEYGSFVYLGELLTNLPLPPDQSVLNQCGQCVKCLEACPMDAIIKNNSTINCQKCLAYQTLTKGHLNNELKQRIAQQKYIYGCDECQLVCPYNQNINNDWHQEFIPDYELVNPELKEIIKLSNNDFKKRFGHMSGSWRGKKNLQRNAILILGQDKDPLNVPLLIEVLENDVRPEIRTAAAWSLGQYALKNAQNALIRHLEGEKDEQVLKEIKNCLRFRNDI